MTNGEKITKVFPGAQIDYHKATDLVGAYVTVLIKGCDTFQYYSIEWWNAEYKEPIDKIDCDHTNCIMRMYYDFCPKCGSNNREAEGGVRL